MQYVPSLPAPRPPDADFGTVRPTNAIVAVHPVSPRPNAALTRAYRELPLPPAKERRTSRPETVAGDRRRFCRRIYTMPVLEELRSGRDRRRRNQRRGDLITAVDEKI